MAETFNYDVFISHSAKDKPAVRELAERLRKDGLLVWLNDWEIKPGDSILLKIQEGLEQARTLVLVIHTSDGQIRWMNVTEYLKKQSKAARQIVFDGEPFTAASLWRMRDRV